MKRTLSTPWLGDSRGYLSDWITQRWVQLTGRSFDNNKHGWLEGPVGNTTGIGEDYFDNLAEELGLTLRTDSPGAGLLEDFDQLDSDSFAAGKVHPAVKDFYENTTGFALDVWSEWCSVFRPFGVLLAYIFSRRLQQLNVPLSALDTSRGLTSNVIHLSDPTTGEVRYTAWVRRLVGTGNVLYAGSYGLCRVPGYDGTCVKVVFPLPNGRAIVIMRPELHSDGSVTLSSSGEKFGDAGFYFVVHNTNGPVVARYVRAMRETIHVYVLDDLSVRADHVLKFWGITFLRLHYRMSKKFPSANGDQH